MMALRRPALVGGGNGSSAPPAGLLGGVRFQLSGTGAGSAPQASVVRSWELPLQRCFCSPVVAARGGGGGCCGPGTRCLRVRRRAAGCMGGETGGELRRGRELGQ